jgi:hypothetical protein
VKRRDTWVAIVMWPFRRCSLLYVLGGVREEWALRTLSGLMSTSRKEEVARDHFLFGIDAKATR